MHDANEDAVANHLEMNRRELIQQSLLGSMAIVGGALAATSAVAAEPATRNYSSHTPNFTMRRVITGHNEQGKSIVVKNEIIKPGLLWATLQDQSLSGNNRERRDLGNSLPSMEAPPNDIRWMIGQIPMSKKKRGQPVSMTPTPGDSDLMHRTRTIDYVYLVSGEITMYCEVGKEVDLKAGDVVIQRNTMHAWRNYGTEPCVILTTMIGYSDTFPPLPA